MAFNNLCTIGALLLCFVAITLAEGCNTHGYKFSDLLREPELNSTIAQFCQDHQGKVYKDGETVRQIESGTKSSIYTNTH